MSKTVSAKNKTKTVSELSATGRDVVKSHSGESESSFYKSESKSCDSEIVKSIGRKSKSTGLKFKSQSTGLTLSSLAN